MQMRQHNRVDINEIKFKWTNVYIEIYVGGSFKPFWLHSFQTVQLVDYGPGSQTLYWSQWVYSSLDDPA